MAAEGTVRTPGASNGVDGSPSRKRKALVLSPTRASEKVHGSGNGNGNGVAHGANGMSGSNGANGAISNEDVATGNGHDENVNGDTDTKDPPMEEESPVVKLVQKKWQMASCVHFFATFSGCLPLSPATENALTPLLLERAVGDPASDSTLSIIYRDVVSALLVALKELKAKDAADRWFAVLSRFVANRSQEFPDCLVASTAIMGTYDSILDHFDGDGMSFIFHTTWKCRLGLLQSLCDIVSEEADCVRDTIKEAERLCTAARLEIEARHYRLVPLGRCSQKRFYYCVGGCRIYSGFKRKGAGGLCVECSDVMSMTRLVETLQASDKPKDVALGTKIKSWYLHPLEEAEEKKRRKLDRELAMEAQREESRRRNADRPRRARASYI